MPVLVFRRPTADETTGQTLLERLIGPGARTARSVLLRRGSAADWNAADPVLLDREPGIDLTNQQVRIGDGTTPWTALPVATGDDALALLLGAV